LVSGYLLDDPIPAEAGFSVANGGIEGFVRAAAPSFDRGVRINTVSPGLVTSSAVKNRTHEAAIAGTSLLPMVEVPLQYRSQR
jgi:NAD(P)-dependent dehydrogenase (short-subunit alcohol dehydrogenase family)